MMALLLQITIKYYFPESRTGLICLSRKNISVVSEYMIRVGCVGGFRQNCALWITGTQN